MRKWLIFFMLISLSFVTVACSGGSTTLDTATEEIVLTDLPQEVDVHTVYDLKDHEEVYLLDVREQFEYDEKHIPGINLLPMSELENRLGEIPTDKTVLVTCRSGNRSNQVTQFLRQNGFDNVHNMSGGIIAWEDAGYPVE